MAHDGADVSDVDRHGGDNVVFQHGSVASDVHDGHRGVSVLEGGVTQPVAERKVGADVVGVVPPVPDLQLLEIFGLQVEIRRFAGVGAHP